MLYIKMWFYFICGSVIVRLGTIIFYYCCFIILWCLIQSRQLESMLIPACYLNSLFLRLAVIGLYCWSVFSDCVLKCGVLFSICVLTQSDMPYHQSSRTDNLGIPGMVWPVCNIQGATNVWWMLTYQRIGYHPTPMTCTSPLAISAYAYSSLKAVILFIFLKT